MHHLLDTFYGRIAIKDEVIDGTMFCQGAGDGAFFIALYITETDPFGDAVLPQSHIHISAEVLARLCDSA